MRRTFGILFIASLASCAKPKQQHNHIIKIELARSGAWADPGAAISIDTSLCYKYYGKIGMGKRQYYTGKIDQVFWDTLNTLFERVHYKTLHISDKMIVADAHYFELIIHWNGGKNRLIKYDHIDANDTLLNTLIWLDDSYKKIKLTKIETPVRFETVLQLSPQIPPVKFLPPLHKEIKHQKKYNSKKRNYKE